MSHMSPNKYHAHSGQLEIRVKFEPYVSMWEVDDGLQLLFFFQQIKLITAQLFIFSHF